MTETYFFDTDCLSAFLWVHEESILARLYSGKIILPAQVYIELQKVPHLLARVNALKDSGDLRVESMEVGSAEYNDYLKMTTSPDQGMRIIGRGEAAGIAMAKHRDGTLASNNLRDIRPYVAKYKISHSGVKGSVEITVEIQNTTPDNPTSTPSKTPTRTPAKPTVKPTPVVKPTVKPSPVPAKAADGTAVGAGASAKAAADAIKKASSDEGPSGTKYGLLQARLKKATKSSIAIRWNSIGASAYIIYGNACGKGKGFEELGRVSGTSFTCSQLADGTKLKKNKYYKFMVMAVKGKGNNETVVATSKTLHITTLGGKYNNFKSIKVTKKPSKKGLKLNKTFKIKATATKRGKKAKAHRKLAYESDNEKVVTVSKSGKIKAVGKGTANVFIYAADGTFKKIKVKVK